MTTMQAQKRTSPPEVVRPSARSIARAARLIAEGRIVAIPTETVYGLAVDAANENAVEALYAAKGRPAEKPFVVQFESGRIATDWAGLDGAAARLAAAFWPGPMTMIVRKPAEAILADGITAGGDTIGIRIPNHPVALDVLRAAGRPLAVTSANLSGTPGAGSVAEIPASLRTRLALILDGGSCPIGVASTVVDMTGARFRILRQGTLSAKEIEEALGS
jgi:L-threonylcarbamoyladenylate synthase